MTKSKVLLLGATGETGGSVLDGLLEYGQDEIIALIRPSSANKPIVSKIKERGVEIRLGDANDSIEKLVELLADIDVFISTMGATGTLEQKNLADAAKKAGVKRFIPCGFITVAPAGGVMRLRDEKEVIYNHIRVLGLPYTFIDCGYWYQLSFPTLPSGRLDSKSVYPNNTFVYGDGKMKCGITDLRDVGRYVARIIRDERTLNKFVYYFGEETTQDETFKLLEELSGEKITRQYVSQETMKTVLSTTREKITTGEFLRKDLVMLFGAEYNFSKFIRGDNTHAYAKYLGYMNAGELYPDFKAIGWRDFLVELLDGKTRAPYPDGLEGLKSEYFFGKS